MNSIGHKMKELWRYRFGCHCNQVTIATRYVANSHCPKKDPLLIDLFIIRHKVVHNGVSPNPKGLLFVKKTTYMAQILQSLSYKVFFIILPKFNTFGLLIPILGTSAIMDQTACCYMWQHQKHVYMNLIWLMTKEFRGKMCFHIISENMSQTRKHTLNDLLITGLPHCQFHYISSRLPKSLKQIMQWDVSSLLSDDETSAYFMAWERHFGQNLQEDLPPGTCMELRLLTLGDSQQPSNELFIRMTTPTSLIYKH